MRRIAVPFANVWESPDRDRLARQFLLGDRVELLAQIGKTVKLRRQSDGYCGWVSEDRVGDLPEPTHVVKTKSALAFSAPDFKAPRPIHLPFRAGVSGDIEGDYLSTVLGFVPLAHLSEVPVFADDPVEVAGRFLGTPYLWGGNTEMGLDCSGLTQGAFGACGIDLPADSGDQLKAAVPVEDPQIGDLVFWTGHVALISGLDQIIHANVHHMCVAYEGLKEALIRIEAAGETFLGYGRVNRQSE